MKRQSYVKMIKIRFQNPSDDARGSLELAKHFKVICLPDDIYEVPEEAINILQKVGIPVKLSKKEGFDEMLNMLRTIRNSPSTKMKSSL